MRVKVKTKENRCDERRRQEQKETRMWRRKKRRKGTIKYSEAPCRNGEAPTYLPMTCEDMTAEATVSNGVGGIFES